MNKDRAIELLKNDCCYECSWGCRNPIECNNKECDYRQAIITAIDSLDNEPKKASITLEELKNKYVKKLEKALAECETGVQANAICEVTNVLIDYIIDNEWRTDTPKESGFYLVTNGENKLDIRKWDNGWYHDMYRRYTNEELKVVAWKKVEPYERKE